MSSIKKNYLYNALYEILVIIIPLITSPYISRVLGAEGIGVYTYHYTVVTYFLLFARLGIQNYGTRSIAGAKTKEERNEIFSSVLLIQIILSVIVLAAYLVYVFLCSKEEKVLAVLLMSYLVSSILDVNWFFFGIEQFKITVSRNIIIKLFSTALIFIFVKQEQDIFIYAIILAFCNFLGQAALWPYLKGNIRIIKPRLTAIMTSLKPIIILFIPQIAVSLYKTMDKIMVGSMCIKSELAFYEYASMIVGLPLGFITSLGTVMLPRTSALLKVGNEQKSREYMHYSILFSVGLSWAFAFGISGVSTIFVPFYFGESFSPTSKLLIGLTLTIPFISWANVIRTQYLIPKKRDKEYIISLFCGAGANLLINALLIPRLFAWGAVIGTIVAEIIVCLVQTYYVNREIPVSGYFKECLPFMFIGGIMYGVIKAIELLPVHALIIVCIQVFCGIFVYLGLSYLYIRYWLKMDVTKVLTLRKRKNDGNEG